MPSKHLNAGQMIRRGLYDDLRSFAELERRISALGGENTKVVGDAFEVFVEGYLATQQKLQAETVWLVGQIPLDIRQQLNLPNDTKGIDGIFRTRTGTFVPYQVKYRSQRAYLTYTEVAPFLGLTERATDRIVFTNSNEVAEDAKNRDGMRTVRGIDFDDLTEKDFAAIVGWLRDRPSVTQKLIPHPYQIEALAKIDETLAKASRAHVVMACGTGKTLVALWAAEALKPKTILVLVPSLTLLQQTLDEWSRHNRWGKDFSYLCVCSDPTVVAKDANDPVRLDAMDLEFRVDTNPSEVRRFIERETPSIKIVFSTYQSLPIVSEGVLGLAPFDMAIFDEAHKTTGPQGGLFAQSLKDENIRIRKRVFFTATPRHYDIRHRDKEGDFRIVSMDDETIYGPRAYTLTFGSAARQGIICNYKVVISVVDGQEINEFSLRHGITLVEGDLIGARWVANQIAVERAVKKTGAKRAITFHSRVSSAKEFSADSSHGVRQFLHSFSVFHVNGDQKSSERKHLIRAFREAENGLITNARCLTEGIDVPAVDMVAFIDPRHSRIDIAQATGRAMRKPRGSDKEVGYVVIPLFLDRKIGETLERALARSDFADVANVLNAMQEQDEDLVQIIREIKEAKGRGQIFDPQRLTEKIETLGPSVDLSSLRSNIFAEVVDTLGVSWDEWFGVLLKFRARERHCRIPVRHIEGDYRLGAWVVKQRTVADNMPPERKKRLDEIGFEWDPFGADWERGFVALTKFKAREEHCRIPQTYVEGDYNLGSWVSNQRADADKMHPDRKKRLDQLGFIWDSRIAEWENGFDALVNFKKREGHCRVPQRHFEGDRNLGRWVSFQRKLLDKMHPDRKKRLDELGFEWDPFGAGWENGFAALVKFKEREGHCRVTGHHIEESYNLGTWITNQRADEDKMPPDRKKRLDELGFVWDPLREDWENAFAALVKFKEPEGHCRVPVHHIEGDYRLGAWVVKRRASPDKMFPDRKKRLDELGFVWDPLGADWENGFAALVKFKEREGHCHVPRGHREGDYKLDRWAMHQRAIGAKLIAERRKRLDELGFSWNATSGKPNLPTSDGD